MKDLQELEEILLSCWPKLDRQEQILSTQIYRLLAVGSPVGVQQLAESLQLSEEELRRILQSWWGVFYDGNGKINSYWGLTLPVTNHQFHVEGRKLHTWCAWDTLFIPQLIDKQASVVSMCTSK